MATTMGNRRWNGVFAPVGSALILRQLVVADWADGLITGDGGGEQRREAAGLVEGYGICWAMKSWTTSPLGVVTT